MKPIKNILFVHRDDRSLDAIFRAILSQVTKADSVLLTAAVSIESAGAELPGTDLNEGEPLLPEVQSALDSLGFQDFKRHSKSIKLHPDLVNWADLILVPRLGEEDLLCMGFHEAWSKTIQIECFCGKYEPKKELLSYSNEPKTEENYLSVATYFKTLLPFLMDKIKDSYANCLIVRGIGMNRGTKFSNDTAIGNASVIRHGSELKNFTKGNILVVDRLGAVLKGDIDKDTIISTIKKFVENPDFYNDKLQEIQDKLSDFDAAMHGKKSPPNVDKLFPDADNALEVVVRNAKAIVCSRGYHVDEPRHSHWDKIPYISSCIGATQLIKDNQLIVVDAARGEVYDASLLRSLP